MTWFDEPFRVSRDLDLLGYGDPAPEAVLAIFREIFGIEERDGIDFDADGARVGRIREDNEYGGLRIRTTADIGGARIAVNVDVGFGDAADPEPEMLDYPVLLDMPSPRLRGYARETVIAEKFQAMVVLGRTNSRMKDYFDIWMLSRSFDFDRARLARAISATFERRRTAIPDETPDALSPVFAEDEGKQRQWNAFAREVATAPGSLAEVVTALEAFLMPAAAAALEADHGDDAGRRRCYRNASGLVSNSSSEPRSHRSILRAVRSARAPRNAHSHTIATRQPTSSRSLRVRRSRSMLAANFACQKSGRVAGSVAYEHPA